MTDADIELLGNEIAAALAPFVIEQRNRALLRELEQIKSEPTGLNRIVTRREFYKFLNRGCTQSNGDSDDFL